ncbi:hypothetical protein CROQUDRAFT_665729, partial [Cronartium quercuum f. sp. fusiforme G11]
MKVIHNYHQLGLEVVILLSLLAFTESWSDYENRRPSEQASPPNNIQPLPQPTSLPPAQIDSVSTEPNEILVTESCTIDALVDLGLKLLSDPLLLYVYVHAPTPSTLSKAVKVAESIKRTRAKKFGEDLQQYVVD